MITVTASAAAEIVRRLEGQAETVGFRIFVKGYGWGGPSMGLALEEPHEDDVKIAEQGARIYLAKQVVQWFEGAELGWHTDNWGGGFTFEHPSISSCG